MLGSPATFRLPLCTYYSADSLQQEIQAAYLAFQRPAGAVIQPSPSAADHHRRHEQRQLLGLVVPHGAACDGFVVAAAAYQRLCACLRARRCRHLTAVLLGTEHRGSVPVATSRVDGWQTPLGTALVDTSAVDYLSQHAGIPVNEAPHAAEHSIENQLPFLLHAAACGWDLHAAGCAPQPLPAAQPANPQHAAAPAAPPEAASLSIVPISVSHLQGGGQLQHMIQHLGSAVRHLLAHIRKQHQQAADSSLSSSSGGSEVVLIATTDFTHAGPWYRELPPPGVSLEHYMRAQDTPVLEAIQQGSVDALLAAAARTRNSMCGLHPLAVALEALYPSSGRSGDDGSSSGGRVAAAKPELLDYRAAHTIFSRPDSTGFAAFAVHACE